jgi:uncharacterized protein YjiS (DUF1127 family)
MGYLTNDISAVAAINTAYINDNKVDEAALIKHAKTMRSRDIFKKLSSLSEKALGRYKLSLRTKAAKRELFAMSDRELSDLGVSRGEIDYVVDGKGQSPDDSTIGSKPGYFKILGRKFNEARKKYAEYVRLAADYERLVAMDARQLADIGLMRDDIDVALKPRSIRSDNDNDKRMVGNTPQSAAV